MSAVLHPIEVEIIKVLRGYDYIALNEIAKQTKLSLDQIRRGVEWLKEKNLVEVKEETSSFIELDTLGEKSVAEGLPERRIHNFLSKRGGREEIEIVRKGNRYG